MTRSVLTSRVALAALAAALLPTALRAQSPAEFYKAALGKGSIKLTLADPSDAGKSATMQLP